MYRGHCVALLLLALALGFLASCDRLYRFSGRVVNADDSLQAIVNAQIFTSEDTTIYTDTAGYFELDKFGDGQQGDKREFLVLKKGFEPQYVNFDTKNPCGMLVKLKPGDSSLKTKYPQEYVIYAYKFNHYVVSVLFFLTIAFVLMRKQPHKLLWLAVVCFLNATIEINYINGNIDISWFGLPLDYRLHPFTIKICLPLSLILYWGYFLTTTVKYYKERSSADVWVRR